MEKIHIQTAQNVSIEYELASLGYRYVATLIDLSLMLTYAIAVSLTLFWLNVDLGALPSVSIFGLSLPIMLYHLLCEIFFEGQSFGKHRMKIKVVKLDGSQVSLGSYLLRWLFRLVDISISLGGIAAMTIIINGRGQRLGDLAAETTVVSLRNRISLSDALFSEDITDGNYLVQYPQVNRLSDQDITTIKEVLKEATQLSNTKVIFELKHKVTDVLAIESEERPAIFLKTILKDYQHLNT